MTKYFYRKIFTTRRISGGKEREREEHNRSVKDFCEESDRSLFTTNPLFIGIRELEVRKSCGRRNEGGKGMDNLEPRNFSYNLVFTGESASSMPNELYTVQ